MDENSKLHSLFEQHSKWIIRTAFRITGSLDDAEDVLQTVFTRLTKRSNLKDVRSDSQRYFRRAAINAALDIIRAKKISRAVSMEIVGNYLAADNWREPEARYSAGELREWLRIALARINPRAAEIIALKCIEGLGHEEIAELMDMSVSTVAVTVHRGRKQLKKEMARFLGESK